jgi:hypothetical protein
MTTPKDDNYYQFDHEAVNKQFGGELTYIGTLPIGNGNYPWALYWANNPAREKGHKDIMMLMSHGNGKGGNVSGRNLSEVGGKLIHTWLQCLKCQDYVVSLYRHDMATCKCGACSIDGGMTYTKVSGNPEDYRLFDWDYLNGCEATP